MRNIGFIKFCVALFLGFLLTACRFPPPLTPSAIQDVQRPTSSNSPTSTGTITTTPCPFVTPAASPTPTSSKLIYVLIDRSGSYGAYTQSAINMLVKSLYLSLNLGDRLYVVWVGAEENPENYLMYGDVPKIEMPLLTPPILTLTPVPTLTITPYVLNTVTPTELLSTPTDMSILQADVASQTAVAYSKTSTAEAFVESLKIAETNQAISSKATQISLQREHEENNQKCLQLSANIANQQILNEWEERQDNIRQKFIADNILTLLTPTVGPYDVATHLFNNLFIASRVIQSERENNAFSSYYLLIFSDMDDQGSRKGEDLEVDLDGVNILVAMMYCKESIYCQNRANYWQDYFVSKGALLPPSAFRIIQETTADVIADFLNR